MPIQMPNFFPTIRPIVFDPSADMASLEAIRALEMTALQVNPVPEELLLKARPEPVTPADFAGTPEPS